MQGESHPDPWKYEIPENKINMKLSEITGSAFKKVPKGRSSWTDPDSVKALNHLLQRSLILNLGNIIYNNLSRILPFPFYD
ncbi:hypothetical protein M8J75_014056 [Diaphorina citri]|nr:hypothetical protein M8J75_014056 [Diaphorina citri]